MPAGNISAVERSHRIAKVKELRDKGKTIRQIADDTGMALTTVKRNLRYAKEIDVGDLKPADIVKKRIEIETELMIAIVEAHTMFDACKADKKRWVAAKGWHQQWLNSLQSWMKLYGLDNVKVESFNFINNQHNSYIEPEHGLSKETLDKIADAIVG